MGFWIDFLRTLQTFFKNLGNFEISFHDPEKQYVVWKAPEICPIDGTKLIPFARGSEFWLLCTKCGFTTIRKLIASESQLEEVKKLGLFVIEEKKTCPI